MSPLKWFKCPDGSITSVEDCLDGCDHECLTLPTRAAIADERIWNGRASTTQLLNGTMLEFLKITVNYGIDPQSRAFMLSGIKHHKMLEEWAEKLNLPAEIALSPDGKDIFDLLVPQDDGSWKLTDNKMWGSYRVARALGLVKTGKGKESVFKINPSEIDLFNEELQLNRYRTKVEKFGIYISGMEIQVTVRDGGLQVATTRGINFNMRLIPIDRLDDSYVDDYFEAKDSDLMKALETGQCEPCDLKECWDGNRCKSWCDVADWCPKGILAKGGA